MGGVSSVAPELTFMKERQRRPLPGYYKVARLVPALLLFVLGYVLGSPRRSAESSLGAAGAAFQGEVSALRRELAHVRGLMSSEGTLCPACHCTLPPECLDPHRSAGCDKGGKYDLTHLSQPPAQDVVGPVQDDEALFLYALVRGMRMSRVLEVGGLAGYSATNFLKALEPTGGVVYTVDINPVPVVDSTRHKTIVKDAALLTAADVDSKPLDLIFFDAHVLDAQLSMYHALLRAGVVTNSTLLAFHDTNAHPYQAAHWSYQNTDGRWVHQPVERDMVNRFHDLGWDALMLHPQQRVHSAAFPYRHGVVVMQKFSRLNNAEKAPPKVILGRHNIEEALLGS